MSFFITFIHGQLKTSKKQSIAIFVGVLMATLFLSFLSGIFETSYKNALQKEVKRSGDWDFKVKNLTWIQSQEVEKLAFIKNVFYESVVSQRAPIKGFKKPYLDIGHVSRAYFENMPIQRKLIQGRFPVDASEILVSKHMLKEHQLGEIINAGKPYKIVGAFDDNLDIDQEYYRGISLLENEKSEEVIAYFKLYNKRAIYKVSESINGEMEVNSELLKIYGIFYGEDFDFEYIRMPLMFGLFLVFVTLLFIFIIKTAFYLNLNSKMKVLGLLRGAGATYKQVALCMYLEALFLSIPAILIGIILGYALDVVFFTWGGLGDVYFTWISVVPSCILALLTAFASVRGALKGFRKLSIIEVLNISHHEINFKKRNSLFKNIGVEMAFNAYYSRRKSHRTFLISFSLVLILMGFLINVNAINQMKPIDGSDIKSPDISFVIKSGQPTNPFSMKKIQQISGVETQIHAELSVNIEGIKSYSKIKLVGIEDTCFESLVLQNGRAPQNTKALTTLKEVTEKSRFVIGGKAHEISDLALVNTIPEWGVFKENPSILMPLTQYEAFATALGVEERRRALYTTIDLIIESDSALKRQAVYDQVNGILSQTYSQDSYESIKHYEIEEMIKKNEALVRKSLYLVGCFIMFVGMVNVFSSISINLHVRQKEFATMQSVGMSLKDIRKFMILEGIFLALSPVMLSLPVNIGIVVMYLKFVNVSISAFLMNLPIYQWLLPLSCLLLTVLLTYLNGYKKVKHRPLAGVLRNELF